MIYGVVSIFVLKKMFMVYFLGLKSREIRNGVIKVVYSGNREFFKGERILVCL